MFTGSREAKVTLDISSQCKVTHTMSLMTVNNKNNNLTLRWAGARRTEKVTGPLGPGRQAGRAESHTYITALVHDF